MRNWNISPKLMCNKHLVGEHGEIHKSVANLRYTKKWTLSLTAKGFLEPQNFLERHNELAKEMINRRMNHRSPLDVSELYLPKGKVDIRKSISDLKERCPQCRFILKV
ncbi:MAG: hypothetical protein JSW73_05305 [Candidatus Woesearchaeota archaeon]|nr:MAG: hypothetical protein JSW73_05305 [Candidatus Woesearchaeota archaeon]